MADLPNGHRPPPPPEVLGDDDLLLRALRALPHLAPPAPRDARIRTRATTELLQASARHERRAQKLARRMATLAHPILPLSIAGLALSYLLWAVHTATLFLPP